MAEPVSERDQKLVDTMAFFKNTYEGYPRSLRKSLNEAVYTCDELGVWYGGFEIKDADLAIRIWALVETIRQTGTFPNELRM